MLKGVGGMKGVDLAEFRQRLAEAPPGPRIEFGVFKGATLAEIARHDGETFGIDSFVGMAEPTERDRLRGVMPYPRGRLAAGMQYASRAAPRAILIQGFVPAVLAEIPAREFAFVHLDMDQYAPTLAAIEWVVPRMMACGMVVCDDWFPGRYLLAAGAINDFCEARGITLSTAGRMAWFRC